MDVEKASAMFLKYLSWRREFVPMSLHLKFQMTLPKESISLHLDFVSSDDGKSSIGIVAINNYVSGSDSAVLKRCPLDKFSTTQNSMKNKKDVIGRVVEIYNPVDKIVGGKATKLIDFQICDNAAKVVSGEVRITSSYDATKIWVNGDFDEFKDFKSQLKVQETPIKSLSTVTLNSQSTGIESFQKGERIVSTIFDLSKLQDGDYYIPGEIMAIESSTDDWYYMACLTPGCNRKLKAIKGVLNCDKCVKQFEEGTARYKLLVRVLDKTTDATFMLWDREVAELVGIPATLLYEKYKKADVDIPTEIEVVIGLKMIFKVGIKRALMKGNNPAYNVMRVLRDEQLLDAYCSRLFEDEEKDLMSQQIEEDENTSQHSEEASKKEEVNSPANTRPSESQVNAQAYSPTTKRSLPDQFSSSKGSKRSKGGSIKKENMN
ncbi:PREDICTED: uncharacterized protein LOC109179507 [Ipomoea nil]|uniref:uncharacterized protein LOC109179507 n=1 Tax=Ipomoea nil TaxID=35883 RepID=UPI00090197D4|nr:PREDICTED: uncharacterized protein LOC109179507 [Ipomoea nil]